MRFRELPIFLIDQEKQNLGLHVEDGPAKAFIDLDSVIAVRETKQENECCIYLTNDWSFVLGMPYKVFIKMLQE